MIVRGIAIKHLISPHHEGSVMNRSILIKGAVGTAFIAANLCAGPLPSVFAQIPNEQAEPPEAIPPTPPEIAPLEEKKIDQFADAYLAIEEVHSKAAAELEATADPVAADKIRANAEMQIIQAVERSGLQLQEFNQIVEIMALNPALRSKIAAKVEERRRI